MNLICPFCNNEKSDTLETRKVGTTGKGRSAMRQVWKEYTPDDCVVRRRHECQACGYRWSTLQLSFDDLNKLRRIAISEKIQTKTKQIQALIEEIESELPGRIPYT
jgi:hypothetical protein